MLNFLLICFGFIMVLPSVVVWLVPAFLLFLLGKWTRCQPMKQFGFNLALGLDQLANVLLLGDPDETISSRTGRAMASGRPKWWVPSFAGLVDFLAYRLFDDKDHCKNAIEDAEDYSYQVWNWIKD